MGEEGKGCRSSSPRLVDITEQNANFHHYCCSSSWHLFEDRMFLDKKKGTGGFRKDDTNETRGCNCLLGVMGLVYR